MEGLYEAEVNFEGDRPAAFREALGQVLVRVTGRRDAAAMPDLEPVLAGASAYVQQFRQPAPGRLWVSFDGEGLARELARLGQPVWGAERPATLVWLAADAGGGRRFVLAFDPEPGEDEALRDELVEAARGRGLPVVLPLMDAEDRASASFAEVWGGFDDAILGAAARYGADGVLVGRWVAGDPGRARWTLHAAGASERWTGSISESVQRLADRYAARFAVVGSSDARAVHLAVSGIESVEDYGRVTQFLTGLTAVEALGVDAVEGDRVVFRVALRGESAALDEAVRLGGLLRPTGASGTRELSYYVAR